MLAVGCDDTNPASGGKVFIYEYSENVRRWTKIETLGSITDPVYDLAFAPNLGRSYHVLAVATKDVRIINLTPVNDTNTIQSGLSKLDIQTVAQFEDHNSTVWRVCWNVTGTILASTGDDGCVRLFKMNHINSWKPVAALKGDGSPLSNETNRSSVGSSVGLATPPTAQTAKYIKLGSIASQRDVPWH